MTIRTGNFVETAAGLIHYREAGAGPPLILLHSNGHSSRQFEPLMLYLAEDFRVIAWDQPGHGDSDRLVRYFSVTDFADAMIGFMDALGLARASVLGNSIGGAIAVDLGVRRSGRLTHLFVCECPLRTPEQWAFAWPSIEANHTLVIQEPRQIQARVAGADAAMMGWWNIDRSKAGGWAMLSVMWALRRYDMHTAMAALQHPVVLVYGAESQLAGSAKAAAALVPNARLEMMDGSGHLPMLDNPKALAEIVHRHAPLSLHS